LGGWAEVLPGLEQERQHLVHPARTGQFQVYGAIESVFADVDVPALALALQVHRPDQVDLVEGIRVVGYRCRIAIGIDRRGQAHPWTGQATLMQDPLDRSQTRQRRRLQSSEFGLDGRCADALIARIGRRTCL